MADRFSGHGDASLGEQIFNIAVIQVKSIVEPDCVADDVWGPPRCGNRWPYIAINRVYQFRVVKLEMPSPVYLSSEYFYSGA